MGKRWHRFRNPWDREYAMRGRLWRGASSAKPLLSWVPKGTRVVELGCGDGKFLAGLHSEDYLVLGLDFSPHALQLAAAQGLGPLVLADVRALPFRDASVGAIAARYVLGALSARDRQRAAAEIERVLPPGGFLLVEEFSRNDFRYGSGREVETATFERNRGIWTHYFDADEAPQLFPSLGLEQSEAVTSRQRLLGRTAARGRWRWILRRQRLEASKASNPLGSGRPA